MTRAETCEYAAEVLDWISVPQKDLLELPPIRYDPDTGVADAAATIRPVLMIAALAIDYAARETGTDAAAVIFDLRTILDSLDAD